MTTDPPGSPPKPSWRETIRGIGSVGCLVASAVIGGILTIVAVIAFYVGVDMLGRWLMGLLWNQAGAAIAGVGLVILGAWAVIQTIRRWSLSGVTLGGRILALAVWASFALVGVILLSVEFSAPTTSSAF